MFSVQGTILAESVVYLEAEPQTGVGQQVDAALHHVPGDAEVGGQLSLHVGDVEIVNVLILGGGRNLCGDHKDHQRGKEQPTSF